MFKCKIWICLLLVFSCKVSSYKIKSTKLVQLAEQIRAAKISLSFLWPEIKNCHWSFRKCISATQRRFFIGHLIFLFRITKNPDLKCHRSTAGWVTRLFLWVSAQQDTSRTPASMGHPDHWSRPSSGPPGTETDPNFLHYIHAIFTENTVFKLKWRIHVYCLDFKANIKCFHASTSASVHSLAPLRVQFLLGPG